MERKGPAEYPPDSELARKAKKGDKNAFAALYDRYKDRIAGFIHGLIGDYNRAQDLTTEAFLSAYKHLGTYTEKGKFSSWIYLIARNLARNELRERRSHKEVSLGETVDAAGLLPIENLIANGKAQPDDNVQLAELKELVYRALMGLNRRYREILILCDIEERTYEEAAEIMKCNPKIVGTWVKRARRQFYKIMISYGYRL
jgi:RNA polymerase sigma-70 factor (ECF subfamily)